MTGSAQSVPDWLTGLLGRARSSDGQPAFSDGSLVEYRTGARHLLSLGEEAAALLSIPAVAPAEAELVVDPDERGRGLGTALLERLLTAVNGDLLIWAHGDHPAARALAASSGFVPVRQLLHLRAELVGTPAGTRPGSSGGDEEVALAEHPGDRLESFVPGRDEAEWLDLNARVFSSHPEQGRLTRAELDEIEAEPWFSAEDFLLLRRDGRLLGYCWLKVEGRDSGGEFYVVGVDPDHQGEGLGGRLTDAGFARLRERGIRSAHLYVEADNAPAVRLYRSRGFADDTVDVQYLLRRSEHPFTSSSFV